MRYAPASQHSKTARESERGRAHGTLLSHASIQIPANDMASPVSKASVPSMGPGPDCPSEVARRPRGTAHDAAHPVHARFQHLVVGTDVQTFYRRLSRFIAAMIAGHFSGGHGCKRLVPCRFGARRIGKPNCSLTSAIQHVFSTKPSARFTSD
jgi:hypothetical protein